VVGTGVALLELVDAAAAAVAPIEIAAGTAMAVPVTAPVVTTAPVAWPPAAAPAAPGACAMVVDDAAGATVCATATPVAAMADNKKMSLMTESPLNIECLPRLSLFLMTAL
jgi:hypothetical protein